MKNTWFKGARSNVDKETRRAEVLAAKPALKVLSVYLRDKIQETQNKRDSAEYHSEFQYSMHQARSAGEINALRNVLVLLDIKEENNV